jgi:3-oxoacyl-(acyl-carrier-protein) synthase
MDRTKILITATNRVTGEAIRTARLGTRFGRMDTACQLALLAVEPLAPHFEALARNRIAIVLGNRASSLSTDVDYWKGRDTVGGPSPTLFTYTLPSAAIGEIAIRHRLTGPNLCLVGNSRDLLREGAELLRQGEADACLCVFVNAVSATLASLTGMNASATACTALLQAGGQGILLDSLDQAIESV